MVELVDRVTGSKRERYHSMDLLRAVMMVLGIVFHGVQMYYVMLGADDYYRDPSRSYSMDAILILTNTFRMPAFFMLSGFFAALLLARRGRRGMLKNRYDRIVVPFLIFLPITAIVMTPLTVLGQNVLAVGTWGFDMAHAAHKELWNKTHNLWFLYYLAMFVGVSALISPWLARASRRLEPGVMSSLWMVGMFALVLGLLGSTADSGRISADTRFLPNAGTFSYFFVCYLYGWFLYSDQSSIGRMAARTWHWLVLAIVAFVISLGAFLLREDASSGSWLAMHLLLSIGTGVSTFSFICFFTGLFERYFSGHSDLGRYFSDSAYWVFLSHSAFLVAFAIPMAHLPWPAELKFLIVSIATVLCCWLSYDWWVRPTWIGEVLNGRRQQGMFRHR